MRISDWSSDVCSSDLSGCGPPAWPRCGPRCRWPAVPGTVGEARSAACRRPRPGGCRTSSAGDCGQDDDLITVIEGGLAATDEANVLVVDVDVDEATQVAAPFLGVEETIADSRLVLLDRKSTRLN